MLAALPGTSGRAADRLAKPFAEAAHDFEKGRYEEAARFYRIMISTYKGSDWESKAGLYLGQCYEKMGQPDQAQAAYRQVSVLSAKEEALEARARLAALKEEENDSEGAAAEYRQIAAADPFSAQGMLALMNLASLQARRKDYAGALKTYERLEMLDSQSPWAAREGWMGAARIFRLQKDYDKAVHALEQVAKNSPRSPAGASAMLLIGHSFHQAGKFSLAAQSYRALADQYADWAPQALVFQGRSLEAAGQDHEAQDTYQRVLDLYPQTLWADAAGHLLGSLRDSRRHEP